MFNKSSLFWPLSLGLSLFLNSTLAANHSTKLSITTSENGGSNTKLNNARFSEIKDVLFATPYRQLPYYKVNRSLFRSDKSQAESRLLIDARRTLSDTRDLLSEKRGQKLLQANGICFVGEWIIKQPSEYSGLFKLGSKVSVIARASATFGGTKQNERRTLGLAIKLLPDDLGASPSLNVFAMHSVGGVKTKYLSSLSLDNEPPLGRIPRFKDISTALQLRKELLKADQLAGSVKPSITYRTVAPIAEYKESKVQTPRWLRFTPANEHRVDRLDFRDELRVEHYPNQQLVYQIKVGSHVGNKKSKAHWQAIGELVLTESVTSKACDTRLHFSHPKN